MIASINIVTVTDHIDVQGDMKGGSPQYFALGEEVWFCPLN